MILVTVRSADYLPCILVLRGHDPFSQHQELQPLATPNFLSTCTILFSSIFSANNICQICQEVRESQTSGVGLSQRPQGLRVFALLSFWSQEWEFGENQHLQYPSWQLTYTCAIHTTEESKLNAWKKIARSQKKKTHLHWTKNIEISIKLLCIRKFNIQAVRCSQG